MSQREVLRLVDLLLKDDSVGLSATVQSLAATLPNMALGNPGPLSADFTFYRGKLPGMRPASGGNVMLAPVRWLPNPQYVPSNLVREAAVSFTIGFECFAASPDDNVDQATLVATAVAQL